MAWINDRRVALTAFLVGVIAVGGMALFADSLVAEVDPNLMGTGCPGGKEWDGPGSSCHNGIIVDYVLPAYLPTGVENRHKVDKKRRRGR